MTTSTSTPQARHKEIARWFYEKVWSQADFSRVAEFLAPTIAFHYRGQASTTSPDHLVQVVRRWRAAFPDLVFEVGAIVAEGDMVAARVVRTGTHQGEWRGIAPTGRKTRVDEMVFLRFEAGQIVEAWEVTDEYAERQQLTG